MTQGTHSALVDEPELVAELHPERAEHARRHRPRVGGEEQRLPRRRANAASSSSREELRDRRAELAVLVDDDVREPLGAPLLRELFERRELAARVRLGTRMKRTASAPAKTPNCEPRVTPVASSSSSLKRWSGLSEPKRRSASAYVRRANGSLELDAEALVPDRFDHRSINPSRNS